MLNTGRRLVFGSVRLPQQSFRLHLVMQCNRVPVVSVRPGKSAVFYEDAAEIFGVFQRCDHRPDSLKQEFKIPRTDGSIGKLQFKREATESTNADYFNHHHLGEHGLEFEHLSPITATP